MLDKWNEQHFFSGQSEMEREREKHFKSSKIVRTLAWNWFLFGFQPASKYLCIAQQQQQHKTHNSINTKNGSRNMKATDTKKTTQKIHISDGYYWHTGRTILLCSLTLVCVHECIYSNPSILFQDCFFPSSFISFFD